MSKISAILSSIILSDTGYYLSKSLIVELFPVAWNHFQDRERSSETDPLQIRSVPEKSMKDGCGATMLSGVVLILGSSWLINSSGRWNVIDLGIGILRHDLQGMAQSICYVRSVRSSNYVSFCNEVSFWLTFGTRIIMTRGTVRLKKAGCERVLLVPRTKAIIGRTCTHWTFCEIFETVFFVVLKCQFEWKRVLFLHIFFASFARILWQLVAQGLTSLCLLCSWTRTVKKWNSVVPDPGKARGR